MTDASPIVLAYSGGLDTTWCIGHLQHTTDSPIVAVTVDVGGFSASEKARLERQCSELGVAEHRWVDARERFFDEVLRHLIYGNVLRGQLYPLSVGAERGLQAQEVARVARELNATQVVHGCTAAGNDQIRFEVALRTLAPELEVLAPIRDLQPSRADEVADLERWGYPVPPASGQYSINSGLWGVTIGGVETLTSDGVLPEEAWLRTRGAFDQPKPSELHTLSFDGGVPSAWDGEALPAVELIERLDECASRFGIGRGVHLGDTILGIKGRVAFEAPAATVIIQSHRELEKLTLTAEQQRLKEPLALAYGDLVHTGRSLDPAARDIEAFFRSTQERVTGDVQLEFRVGSSFVAGVNSDHSLMAASKADYGEAVSEWTPADAAGLGRLQALPGVLHRSGSTIRQGVGRSTDMKTLYLDKIASVTRNCQLTRECKVSEEFPCREGDVVAVRILNRKTTYNQLELVTGRFSVLKPGDIVAGVLGHRRALNGYAGRVPESLAVGQTIQLLNLGGVLGECLSANPDVGVPFECEVLGQVLSFPYLGERIGVPASISDQAAPQTSQLELGGVPVVAVVGTCMNSGKSAACNVIIQELSRNRQRVHAAKATGVSLQRDVLGMEDAGAQKTMTFTDLGIVTTTRDTAPVAARSLLTTLARSRPDVIVLELGDGLLGDYGVDAILEAPDLREAMTAVVFAAGDPVGAWGGMEQLRRRFEIEPTVVTGPATDNAAGSEVIRDRMKVAAWNARTEPRELMECILNRLQVASEGASV